MFWDGRARIMFITVPGIRSLKLLLRDFKLSDDISLRFSNSEWNEYPLFADKYIDWIDALPQEEQVINIFMELSALGMAPAIVFQYS